MESVHSRSGNIQWPNPSRVVSIRYKDPIVAYTEKLFYNTSTTILTLYLILRAIVVPTIGVNYEQRHDLSASILLQLRKLVSSLQQRLKHTPLSAIGFNEHDGKVEKSTQTSDSISTIQESRASCSKPITELLKGAKDYLEDFNSTNNPSQSMNDFSFHMKLLVDELHHNTSSEGDAVVYKEVISSIREMKGWFVNGRVA